MNTEIPSSTIENGDDANLIKNAMCGVVLRRWYDRCLWRSAWRPGASVPESEVLASSGEQVKYSTFMFSRSLAQQWSFRYSSS